MKTQRSNKKHFDVVERHKKKQISYVKDSSYHKFRFLMLFRILWRKCEKSLFNTCILFIWHFLISLSYWGEFKKFSDPSKYFIKDFPREFSIARNKVQEQKPETEEEKLFLTFSTAIRLLLLFPWLDNNGSNHGIRYVFTYENAKAKKATRRKLEDKKVAISIHMCGSVNHQGYLRIYKVTPFSLFKEGESDLSLL